jgi:hypothetical protein
MRQGWIHNKDKREDMFRSYLRALTNSQLDSLSAYQVERMYHRDTADDARERADSIRVERARRMG